MKAIYVEHFGGPEVMRLVDRPDPTPGPGQVLVRVRASGMNFAETRMREGTYLGQKADFILGMESAGDVESVGEGVTGFKPGDRVFGRARGSHAQLVNFDARNLMHLPDSLTHEQGAAIPVGWLTAWHALITVAPCLPGDRVLIEGIGSSVGSAALQIAKWRGCWVAGTASRASKIQRALSLGADAAYNYVEENITEAMRRDTGDHGADIALLVIAGPEAERTIAAMAHDGRVLLFGSTGGRRISFDLGIGERNLRLLGMSITSSARFYPDTMRTFQDHAIPRFADGTFTPLVDVVLNLEDIVEAHRLTGERDHFGKIILRVP